MRPLDVPRAVLGEGPAWDSESATLSWIDIDDGRVFSARYDDALGPVTTIEIGGVVGCALPIGDSRFLVALECWIGILFPNGHLDKSRALITTGRRFNDGKVDPQGRFIVGSLRRGPADGRQQLLRLETNGTVTVLDDDLHQSNGLGWSPDGSVFYNADTPIRTVYQRSYSDGSEGDRTVFATLDGMPDGLTVDSDGNLWITIFDLERIDCYSPDGTRIAERTIQVPGYHPASVEFAGADLGDLVITTGMPRLENGTDAELRYPDDGAVLVVRPDATGAPTTRWNEVPLPR